jgi:murein DD-endopeptidase
MKGWSVPLICLLTLLGLSGCASQSHVTMQQIQSTSPQVRQTPAAVKTALAQLDKPYRYGGSTPRGFDCSGLVYYAYLHNGIAIPRTSQEQLRNARRIALSELAPGDLLFFRQRKRRASHVGLYIGDGRFIHASTSEGAVKLSQLTNPYWQAHLITAGRYGE